MCRCVNTGQDDGRKQIAMCHFSNSGDKKSIKIILKEIKIIRSMYELWFVFLTDYCTQIVVIGFQVYISIDSNTKLKKDQNMKQLDIIITCTWNNVTIHKDLM